MVSPTAQDRPSGAEAGRSVPVGARALDPIVAAGLCLVAMGSFSRVFSPEVVMWRVTVAVAVPLVLGEALRWRSRRPSLPVSVVVAALAYLVVVAATCFRIDAPLGFLPGPEVMAGIGRAVTDGASLIVTSTVPAPSTGELLAIPVTIAFWGSFVATEATRRTRSRLAAPGIAVLLAVIGWLFGPSAATPQWLLVAVLVASSLAFIVLRGRNVGTLVDTPARDRPGPAAGPRRSGAVAAVAVALVGVVMLSGLAAGSATLVPVGRDRLVLRDRFDAPVEKQSNINPLLLVSPAMAHRADPREVLEMRMTGTGSTIARMPVMFLDRFDCRSGELGSSSASMVAGSELPEPDGPADNRSVDVRYRAAEFNVLPVPGVVTSIDVDGDPTVYFDPSTRLVSLAAPPVETIGYRAMTRPVADVDGTSKLTADVLPAAAAEMANCPSMTAVDTVEALAASGVTGAGDPWSRVQSLVSWCRSLQIDLQGQRGADLTPAALFPPTAGAAAEPADQPAGTAPAPVTSRGEGSPAQIISACTLLGRQVGLPVRAAVGYLVSLEGGRGSATSNDLWAWLEVRSQDGTWHPMEVLAGDRTNTPPPPTPSSGNNAAGNQTVSPPVTAPPTFEPSAEHDDDGAPVGILIGVGVGVVATAALLLARATAARRSRRRRRRGSPERRITGAWDEAVDLLRSYGIDGQVLSAEELASIGTEQLPSCEQLLESLAVVLASVFSPDGPTDTDADAAWGIVDEIRSRVRAAARTQGRAPVGAAEPVVVGTDR